MPGEDTWLVAEYRSSGERKYYLSNPARPPDLQAFEALLPIPNSGNDVPVHSEQL